MIIKYFEKDLWEIYFEKDYNKYVHNNIVKIVNTIGFILIVIMIIQVISGIYLTTFYIADISNAFISITYISKEVNHGYILKNLHANNTTIIFILLILHKLKAIKENIYSHNINTFYSGTAIYIITMAIGFLGYTIAWGQMSFWGGTVITNLIIISNIKTMIIGSNTVSQPALSRFYTLHFILPLLMLVMIGIHIIYLHNRGSTIS